MRLLGPPAVQDGPVERKVAGRQGALLAALALHARKPVSVDRLVEVVWGADPPSDADNALQQRVSRLRAVVDPDRRGDVLVRAAGGYSLQVDEGQVDVRRFEQLAALGRQQLADGDLGAAEVTLGRALDLWDGPALAGFSDELWAVGECRRLEELRLTAAEDRAQAIARLGDHDRAIGELVELVPSHPLRERLRGQLMLALYGAGRQADALEVYDDIRRLLAEELGVDPGPRLQRIHRQILIQDASLAADTSGPASAPPATRGNLPTKRSRVVGREHALDQIAQLLDHTRLLTVTGPGGAGKTTLAVEAGRRRPPPPDGIWLVELAPVSTGEAVATTIAGALGLAGGGIGEPGVDAAALTRMLAGKRLLLVLDNCEHVIAAVGSLVQRLLGAAAGVQVLATSREPLGLDGEVVWSVPGLGLPAEGHTTAEDVGSAPAVALLVERAGAHTPGFALTDETAPTAATLVRRLDGIPLAIELAAARLRVLSLAEVADRLDDRFRLLAGHVRTAASRQRTLRNTLDWSWDLLDGPLRHGWAALAVSAGRFDLATASALLEAAAVDVAPLDVVADLVDRSLLSADTSATPTRYRMLESIRDYGRERLVEQGRLDEVHARHADVLEAALASCHASTSPQRFGVDVDGLAAWLDDARVALRWADGRDDRPRLQRIAGLLGWLWLLRGLSAEGLRWLDRGLGAPERADPADDDPGALLWASALRAASTLTADGRRWADQAVQAAPTPTDRVLAQVCAAGHHANAGDLEKAVAALDAGEAEAQAVGGWPLGFARLIRGQLSGATGSWEAARSQTEEAVALLSAAGAEWAHLHALESLISDAAVRGDPVRARDLALEGVRLCRRLRYPELESAMLVHLGYAADELGEVEEAASRLDQAVARAAEVGADSGLAHARVAAGTVARRHGRIEAAREHLRAAVRLFGTANVVLGLAEAHRELARTAALAGHPGDAVTHAGDALAVARDLGVPHTLALAIDALAEAVAVSGDHLRAVTLLGTAAGVREASGSLRAPADERDLQRTVDALRAHVGDATFERAWTAARRRAADQPERAVAQVVGDETTCA